MPGEGESHLVRYGRALNCCEINSTFRRRHRAATYRRWSESVPDNFAFCLKLPQEITHQGKLVDCGPGLEEFLQESEALGDKRALLLVQTPPKLAFDRSVAQQFFSQLSSLTDCGVACEPRHPTWFTPEAEALLSRHRVARVAADPPPVSAASQPGGWSGLRYYRWHGSPRVYYDSYSQESLEELARKARAEDTPTWCIFDNTTLGAGTRNALTLRDLLGERP